MPTWYWAVSSELKKHCGQHCYDLIWNTAHDSNHTYEKMNKFELKMMEPEEKKNKLSIKKNKTTN